MGVSYAKLTAGGRPVSYYTDQVSNGRASYYTGGGVLDGDPPGVWWGDLASDLGLDGLVRPDQLAALVGAGLGPDGLPVGRAARSRAGLDAAIADAIAAEPDPANVLPERLREITSAAEKEHGQACLAWDLTLTAPKSLSVLYAAYELREQLARNAGSAVEAARWGQLRETVEGIVWDANEAGLRHLTDRLTSRAGRHGGASTTARWVAAPGVAVARFFQRTSRAEDTHLHVHNVLPNRVRCLDGVVRAIDGTTLCGDAVVRKEVQAVADRAVRELVEQRLGLAMEFRDPVTPGAAQVLELAIMDPQLIRANSERARAIGEMLPELLTDAAERKGAPLTKRERNAIGRALSARQRKTKRAAALEAAGRDVDDLDADLFDAAELGVETRADKLDRWNAMAQAETGRGLGAVADDAVRAAAARSQKAFVPVSFSRAAVISAAVAQCAESAATWTRGDLLLTLERALPGMGGADPAHVEALLDSLADEVLRGAAGPPSMDSYPAGGDSSSLVRHVAGLDVYAADDQLDHAEEGAAESGVWLGDPHAARYAATNTIEAEEAMRRAASERGRRAVSTKAIEKWLGVHGRTVGADQRAAIVGLATSDAALAVLQAPAGAGKSFTVGKLAQAWRALSGARVVGLAVAEIAAGVLREDGLPAFTVAQFLATQDRIAAGAASGVDAARTVQPGDILAVDEASMIGTGQLRRIQDAADAAGARVLLVGDARQLAAVDAGGILDVLPEADTFALTEVRRFSAPWEAEASLRLRAGDVDALDMYDRHGRLRGLPTIDDAIDAGARAVAADLLDGRSVLAVAGTNEQAAAVAGRVRAHLVAAGALVDGPTVTLRRDGVDVEVGVGDLVQGRLLDRGLGLVNRGRYRVTEMLPDGGIRVVDVTAPDAGPLVMPAAYVAEHASSGYCGTVHAVEGLTLDACHLVTDGSLDRAALYVAMSRGRTDNVAWVGLHVDGDTVDGFNADRDRPTAGTVLAPALDRHDDADRAALYVAEREAAEAQRCDRLLGLVETEVQLACRARLDDQLAMLAALNVLPEDVRERLAGDRSCAQLSRQLRVLEQAGHDPATVLAEAIGQGGLDGPEVRSVARVLQHRIDGIADRLVEHLDPVTARVPADIGERSAVAIEAHLDALDNRAAELGSAAAEEAPRWAVDVLGQVPDGGQDPVGRLAWERAAGAAAVVREANGWADETRPLPEEPGTFSPQRRALWHGAFEALGRPQPEVLPDETLRAWVTAGERARQTAPPHADAALRAASLDAAQAREESLLGTAAGLDREPIEEGAARKVGGGPQNPGQEQPVAAGAASGTPDRENAVQRLPGAPAAAAVTESVIPASVYGIDHAAAEQRATVAEQLAEERAAWAAAAGPVLAKELAARVELGRRDLAPGEEHDRTTLPEWLAAEEAARVADDPDRDVTERDYVEEHEARGHHVAAIEADLDMFEADAAPAQVLGLRGGCAEFPEHPSPTETATALAVARVSAERLAAQTAREAAEPEPGGWDAPEWAEVDTLSAELDRDPEPESDELVAAIDDQSDV